MRGCPRVKLVILGLIVDYFHRQDGEEFSRIPVPFGLVADFKFPANCDLQSSSTELLQIASLGAQFCTEAGVL